jgi:hypothetical protein
VTARELELRKAIFSAFAETGEPPAVDDRQTLRGLAAHQVVVLDDDDRIRMAHPFAAHREGARVDAGERTWWGNCTWDGLGIVAALGLQDATVTGNGIALAVGGGRVAGDAVFHVAVPARHWWEDIGFT